MCVFDLPAAPLPGDASVPDPSAGRNVSRAGGGGSPTTRRRRSSTLLALLVVTVLVVSSVGGVVAVDSADRPALAAGPDRGDVAGGVAPSGDGRPPAGAPGPVSPADVADASVPLRDGESYYRGQLLVGDGARAGHPESKTPNPTREARAPTRGRARRTCSRVPASTAREKARTQASGDDGVCWRLPTDLI
jgi:hypothetical protein